MVSAEAAGPAGCRLARPGCLLRVLPETAAWRWETGFGEAAGRAEEVKILGIPRGGEYFSTLGFGGGIAEGLRAWRPRWLSAVTVTAREQG